VQSALGLHQSQGHPQHQPLPPSPERTEGQGTDTTTTPPPHGPPYPPGS
jgi:hypothetical protein